MNILDLRRALTTLVVSLLVAGCATTVNDRQRATLTAVSVGVPTTKEDAYHNPEAKRSPGMANTIPAVTGGGLVPALLGSAIDASVTSSQQKRFEKTGSQYFDRIKAMAAEPPITDLQQEAQARLKADEFFGERVVAQGGNIFSLEITRFGLVRAPSPQKDDFRFCYEIECQVSLRLAGGDSVINEPIVGTAPTGAHIEDYIAQPELIAEQKKAALAAAGFAFRGVLDRKLGRYKR
jgi:hypothetical protein